jgi:HEAT repeat protein
MSSFMSELQKQCQTTWHAQVAAPLLQFVTTGDAKPLGALKKAKPDPWTFYWLNDAWAKMSSPSALTEEERRALFAAGMLDLSDDVAMHWLNGYLARPSAETEAAVTAFVEGIGGGSQGRVAAAKAIIARLGEWLTSADGKPSPAGRFLLSLSDNELASAGDKAVLVEQGLAFLLRHAPDRVPAVAASFIREGSKDYRNLSSSCCRLLMSSDRERYEPVVAAAVEKEKKLGPQARALDVLAEYFPDKYRDQLREINLKIIGGKLWGMSFYDAEFSAQSLLTTYGIPFLPQMEGFFKKAENGYLVVQVLDWGVGKFGSEMAPAAVLAAEHPLHDTQRAALAHLMSWPQLNNNAVIRKCLVAGLAAKESGEVVKFIGLVARWKPDEFGEPLWKLFEHKSKPVRSAAARSLAKLGKPAVERAIELLAASKAVARSAAVTLLSASESSAAMKALETRLDDETDEEVRDQMLLALEQSWEKQGRKITRAEIDRRIERTADKLKAPVAKWVNEKKLPELHFAGKKAEKLSPQAVRYLLYRQSRAKEMRADVEAKPLYALIDRKSSGDFALPLLQQFLGSPQAAEDRWALAVAGLLGDDRSVNVLMQQIRKWVDSNRGKLAEYAAQALALLGTDVALTAVDSLSIRYRSKQKNIGKAAGEAFAEAAERLGMTPDELGDRVVPWLGFEPSGVRLIEEGDKKIEARISLDHKLEFRDLAKGKKIGTLPAGIPAEIKTEFKDLAATIREVVKGQLVRIENLMVRQYRWPIGRWRELYLAHPLLLPFACRMIWGVYDEQGKLVQAFRALEDRTLTDEQDSTVELPKSGQIGLVHPLDLTAEQRQAWATHLADYNIRSPILQIERPVIRPQTEEQPLKMSGKYKGTDLNGMTFKGRAERLGWQRGAVVDAGSISSYRKSFAGAGADAVIEVDGMYIGMGMEDTVKLGRFYFIKSGSVTFGSYTYDEPGDEKDARLIAFGDAPPIVYSETLGDLARIAGTKEEAAE